MRTAPAAAVMAFTLAAVVGGIALQLASGGVRGQSLSPAVLAVALGAFGSALLVRRPRLRFGPLLCVNGPGFGAGTLAAGVLDYGSVHGVPHALGQAAFVVVWLTVALIPAWALFILWFPDGEFAGAGWRRFFVAGTALSVAVAIAGVLAGPAGSVYGFFGGTDLPAGVAGPFAGTLAPLGHASTALLAMPLVSLVSLAQRLRRGGPVVRRQVRLLLAAFAVEVVGQIVSVPLVAAGGVPHDVGVVLSVGTQPLPLAAATLAIFRHRLWDLELVVSRALVYAVLWAALALLLLAPGLAAGLLVGGRGALAAVGIALVVTVVFQPARARLERLVEHLVWRHRARPRVLLAGFWETLRTSDLATVGPLLAAGMREGLGVRWAGLWLYSGARDGGVLRTLGAAGLEQAPAVLVSADAAARLLESPGAVLGAEPPPLWPEPPAAVVPLVAAHELVGVLACGPRPGDALAAPDFALLEVVARECALRLRNLRLEGALREQLAQIERQAEELRSSRERLVRAQDEERRRIERDLHDGVQQQLLGLAVRLRHAREDPLLRELADEAEAALFALQELGRGIYPSVLADRGLPAALRTQAARMPMTVRIAVDPALADRRLGREREAALYYVALEALTNAQKHAPGATVDVWLRLEDGGVALDVVDDGPGIVARRPGGTGLQNMDDRLAAIGGTLALGGGPGRGTRVSAALPAATLARQPAEADSRR
ncbi:MAG TPA: ATP-binding protein [Gaiellaceae bacterium]|nr:ATP-binding protein [Gaiellaceae bacterium]